jgi:acetyl esterase/lipase
VNAAVLLLALGLGADPAPKAEPLWPGKAPAAVGDSDTDKPTLTRFAPPADKANGTAVVVCPGGGYGFLANDHEGKQIAEWLVARGVNAFVLKYRIATKDRPGPLHPAPMLDVQRAIRTVRANARTLGIDPARVGVWGFSAGGHLASTAATHFDAGKPDAEDPIERVSSRPDFAILAYPVVSMDPAVTHGGSRRNLLGDKPDAALVELMSNDKQVTKETPPTFIFHTADDEAVKLENALRFKAACEKVGVPVELAEYPKGPHGVGLAQKIPDLKDWPDKLEAWMKGRNLLPAK